MTPPRQTVAFVSLGCPKNLVDSEQLVGRLLGSGYRILSDPKAADLVVVNTCGFLESSRAESLATIREAVALKTKGVKAVMVAGCMVGNYRDEIEREAPGVDRLVPFSDYERIDRLAEGLLPETPRASFLVERERQDVSLTPGHYAWLKISEGCNHHCSFCVIPSIRGPMRSVGMEDLLARARGLAARGVREIDLVAQDSTVWGVDLYGENRLDRLLARLARIDDLAWIRLMYAYPTEVKAPLMDVLTSGGSILPYLDVPIQHAADGVLRRMCRGYGRRDLERLVQGLRGRRADFALRTTVIVGFPGETDRDFEELLEFIRGARFDRLGAFRYSQEPGSGAATLPDQVEESVKEERWHRLMALQQEIAFAANRALVGTRETMLVDAVREDGAVIARTRRDAPDVDAGVRLKGEGLRPGDLVPAEIVAADGYDLVATALARGSAPVEV